MALAIVYGVYTVFFSTPREAPVSSGDKQLEALNSFITKVADKTKSGLPEDQLFILQKARAEWKQDPLIRIQPKLTREEEEKRQPLVLKSKILYTGFLEMGDKKLAIINGVEYEVGDRLEAAGLVVRMINPNHVVVAAPDENNKTVIIPMEEIE